MNRPYHRCPARTGISVAQRSPCHTAALQVVDPARAIEFCGKVAGLRLVADEPAALVFDSNTTMLRNSKVREFTPAPFTVPGWKVEDIRSAVSELVRRSATFQRYECF